MLMEHAIRCFPGQKFTMHYLNNEVCVAKFIMWMYIVSILYVHQLYGSGVYITLYVRYYICMNSTVEFRHKKKRCLVKKWWSRPFWSVFWGNVYWLLLTGKQIVAWKPLSDILFTRSLLEPNGWCCIGDLYLCNNKCIAISLNLFQCCQACNVNIIISEKYEGTAESNWYWACSSRPWLSTKRHKHEDKTDIHFTVSFASALSSLSFTHFFSSSWV